MVSSHITSDLEKIADYIVFIHEGKVLFSRPKDELIEQYGIIKCNAKQFDELNKKDIIRYRKQDYEWQVLVANRQKQKRLSTRFSCTCLNRRYHVTLCERGMLIMKGLLLKDYFAIKSSMIILLIGFVVFGFGVSFYAPPYVLMLIASIILGQFVTTTIYSDRKCGWLKSSITFPTSKNHMLAVNILCMLYYVC